MRAHIVGAVSEVDLEILVSKDFFILAKDGIGEARVKGGYQLKARRRRRNEADVERRVRVGDPCING